MEAGVNGASRSGIVYSIVAPVFNEEAILPEFYRRIVAVMEQLGEPFELVLINDGSRDGTLSIMRQLSRSDKRVRVISFSRNFGHQISITAGIDFAQGQAVIVIDSDLQDPPEVIPDLIAKWKEGYEVIYAVRAKRHGETAFKLLTAKLFYRLIRRITSVDIPEDTGDFRLMDRKAVDIMKRMREHHRFMRGLSAWVGFNQIGVEYVRQERFAGSTKYPLKRMLKFAMDAITGFSYVPLQLATSIGFTVAMLSLLGIIAAIVTRLLGHELVGQGTTIVIVLFLGGVQLMFLGIIGEYLGRIYDEVKGRPLYIVAELWGYEQAATSEEPRRIEPQRVG